MTCSTRLPLVEEVVWVSPDLNIEPRLAARSPVGAWEIRLPWGCLLVRRDGDMLTVDAIGGATKR